MRREVEPGLSSTASLFRFGKALLSLGSINVGLTDKDTVEIRCCGLAPPRNPLTGPC
jgi:hypothetical protein